MLEVGVWGRRTLWIVASAVFLGGCADEDPGDGVGTGVAVSGEAGTLLLVEGGEAQTLSEGATVTLTGTVDSDDEALVVGWEQVDGPTVELTGADTLTPTFVAPAVPTETLLVFRLSAEDSRGQTGSDDATVLVRSTNEAPVVDAGDAQSADAGAAVSLAGVASDADGEIASVAWEQLSGEALTLSDAAVLAPSFTAPHVPIDSDLVFQLTVTDDDGASAHDSVVVTVISSNAAPIVDAGLDQDAPEQTSVELAGTAADSDGTIASVGWTQVGGLAVTLTESDTDTATFTAPVVTQITTLAFELSATDDAGATTTDTMLVTVTPLNLPPAVLATADPQAGELTTVALTATASDPDGAIVRTTWSQLLGPTVTIDDSAALNTTFDAPDVDMPEQFVFELEAEDNEGATSRDTVVIQVNPMAGSNAPPLAYAGPDEVTPAGSQTSLAGMASDPDGTIVRTTWTQLSGTVVTLTGGDTLAPSFSAPQTACAESLVFELEVEDNEGATTTDRVGVSVSAALGNPIALGTVFDFEGSDGGITTDGTLWQRGVPTSGPGTAFSGGNVWATNLTGNFPHDASETICMPPVDRAGAARATVSFRVWMAGSTGDFLRIEALNPSLGWVALTTIEPAYDDPSAPGWTTRGRNDIYDFASALLPGWATETPNLRFVFVSNSFNAAAGGYIDDVRFDSEATDPDGDGLFGVQDEYLAYGTDPFVADTDGDGVNDGQEITDATDPINPADYNGSVALVPGDFLDFELNDGGLAALDKNEPLRMTTLWARGVPASGPVRAHSGNQAWATNLAGNYVHNERAYLFLPPLDLSGGGDPTLAFRLWSAASTSDGLSVEVYDASNRSWTALVPEFPAYNTTDGLAQPSWGSVNRQDLYTLVALSLKGYTDSNVRLRLVWRSNSFNAAAGAYVDDVALFDESADPDGDGVAGVIAEHELYGTDPFVADTDGDGVNDGMEIAADTDPLDAAEYTGAATLTPPFVLDFESDDGGLSATTTVGADTLPDDLWEHGTPASGPSVAHSGANVWATNLGGNFANSERSFLNLPVIDLTNASDPTLSFRLWSAASTGDGVSVEIYDEDQNEWQGLTPAFPAYNATDGDGEPSFGTLNRQTLYSLVAVSLADHIGAPVRIRFAFRSNTFNAASGAYLDDVGLHEETDDPDGDGLLGVIAERETYGTDPHTDDTDGDGINDGDEESDGTGLLDPSWYADGPKLAPGSLLDFELSSGGVSVMTTVVNDQDPQPGNLWERGEPASGPGGAYSGSQAWSTNPFGNFDPNERCFLHLPPIDLSGVSDAALSFRLHHRSSTADGTSVEFLDVDGSWAALTPTTPAYDDVDATGRSAWGTQGYLTSYSQVLIPLTAHAGITLHTRLAFRSNSFNQATGATIDDVAVDSEASDPDNDGIVGVVDEWQTYGTDPYVADTDGDGVNDGDEVAQGTDPLNPAHFLGAGWTIDTQTDLETDNGGFATRRTLWEYGAPASGPGAAASGARVWATDLSGNFFNDAREYLYSPPLEIPAGVNASFGFHLWMSGSSGDGVSVEIWDDVLGWQLVPAGTPAYDSTDGIGQQAWRTQTGAYHFAAVSLAPWAGATVRLRLAFRSNGFNGSTGAYVDDFAFYDETSDPDGDGIPGLLNEFINNGTDPLDATDF